MLWSRPNVAEAVAFGVPDDKYGEEINSAVIGRDGYKLEEAEVLQFCKKNLASFKLPKRVFIAESLPNVIRGYTGHPGTDDTEAPEMPEITINAIGDYIIGDADHSVDPPGASTDIDDESGKEKKIKTVLKEEISTPVHDESSNVMHSFLLDENHVYDGSESGTEEEQSAFMKELENFFKERAMEFTPKLYGEGLN